MTCEHCCGADKVFDEKEAAKQLKRYRKKGPRKTSRLLIKGIKNTLKDELSILDIGGGIGVVHHELLKNGLKSATQIDASLSYLDKAKEEAERNKSLNKVTYHHGDFLDIKDDIKQHDIVVLDKVICCYPHMKELLSMSSLKTDSLIALVYPKSSLIGKMVILGGNGLLWFKKNAFRVFLHSNDEIRSQLKNSGFNREYYKVSYPWNIEVYKRSSSN